MKRLATTKENKKDNLLFNIGLCLLRMIMCYFVVIYHCLNLKTIKNKLLLKLLRIFCYSYYQVPVFFIMSFYFSYNTFKSNKINKKIIRIGRLLIPYICWPIIIFLINYYIYLRMKVNLLYSLNDLKMQLIYGHKYLTVFWYQWNIILILILFIIILSIFKTTYYFFFILLAFLSYYFTYSGKNIKMFSKYPSEIKFPTGRMFESIPFCIIGFFIADMKLMSIFEIHRFKVLFFTFLFGYFFTKFKIFEPLSGFDYQGIRLIIVSTLFFISFALFPSQIIKNKKIINTIKQITNYTMGIYVLHNPIGKYANMSIINYNNISIINTNTLTSILIRYQTCYLCCYFCMKIVKNTKMRNLFS